MAKNDKNTDEVVVVEEAPVAPVPAAPQVQLKLVSFEQYCAYKKVLPHHMAGMRAFCSSPSKLRPIIAWEAIFATY